MMSRPVDGPDYLHIYTRCCSLGRAWSPPAGGTAARRRAGRRGRGRGGGGAACRAAEPGSCGTGAGAGSWPAGSFRDSCLFGYYLVKVSTKFRGRFEGSLETA